MTSGSIIAKFPCTIYKTRINNQIRASELFVIGDDGANLGVMSNEAAQRLAREKGLDLVEISPMAKPPVARIVSFDKFRYQQAKKIKQQRAKQKSVEAKQIQISVGEAKHDLERKAGRVKEFLEEGSRVEILLVVRGRQKAHKGFAKQKLEEFMKTLDPDSYKVISEPKFAGKGFSTYITKK